MELTPWDLWPTPKSGAPAPVAFLMASSSLGRRCAVGSAFYTQTSRHIDPYAALRAVWHRSTDYLCHFAVISRGSETLTNWPLGTQLATRLTRRFHRVYSETTRASRQLPGKKNTQKTKKKQAAERLGTILEGAKKEKVHPWSFGSGDPQTRSALSQPDLRLPAASDTPFITDMFLAWIRPPPEGCTATLATNPRGTLMHPRPCCYWTQ